MDGEVGRTSDNMFYRTLDKIIDGQDVREIDGGLLLQGSLWCPGAEFNSIIAVAASMSDSVKDTRHTAVRALLSVSV